MTVTPDAFRLDGKVAIVTGGGGAICGAIARTYAAAGARVGVLDQDAGQAQAVAADIAQAGGSALAVACDVSREDDVERAVAAVAGAFGPATVLVNGAAALDRTGTLLEIDLAEWNRVLAVNLTSAFLMSRAVLPGMIAAGGGSIIHIASSYARVGRPGRAAYCATKGALVQLAKVMAADHGAQNVRVNTLSPGGTATRRLLFRFGGEEGIAREVTPYHRLGRFARPDEMSGAALYLASDASSFMTGADLLVDGGFTSG
ncbi:MAG: SDR family oxidoreductase [Burkholderiales bacterium]|nr:SDR family oxidoreductase [Burkholderiales bacterium]